jgi:hypothetical protein
MRIRTLFRYLVGDRGAIVEIATDPRAVWTGLLFVLSAGFAREYDVTDLLHEPWHLLLPLGASLLSSFLLFTLAYGIAVLKGAPIRSFFTAYRSFLGLFWMTAPLAWLYAIPYERFLTPGAAVVANLLTLGLVSAWRVALMIRVLQVILEYRARTAAFLVLLFADGVALTLMYFLPVPLIDVMGGIRLSEGDRVLQGVAQVTCTLGALALPVLLLGAGIGGAFSKPIWRGPVFTPAVRQQPSRGLLGLAVSSVLVWGLILPFTQPEQQRRRHVEDALDAGDIRAAVAEMSAHERNDFPPYWNPPPRVVWMQSSGTSVSLNQLLAILQEIADTSAAPWVRVMYLNKLRDALPFGYQDREFPRARALLRRLLESPALVEELEREGAADTVEELKRYMREPVPGQERKPESPGAPALP